MKQNISHLTTGVLTLTGANAAGLVEVNLLDNFLQSGTGGSYSFSSQFIPGGTFSNFQGGLGAAANSSGVVNPGTNSFYVFGAGVLSSVYAGGVGIGRSFPNAGFFSFFGNASWFPQARFDGAQYWVKGSAAWLNGSSTWASNTVKVGSTPQSTSGFISVSFSHNLINGGQQTLGLVQLGISNINQTSHRIEAQRLIFEDVGATGTPETNLLEFYYDTLFPQAAGDPQNVTVNTELTEFGTVENGVFTVVPEPSSIALLALGASGLITRRRRESKKNAA